MLHTSDIHCNLYVSNCMWTSKLIGWILQFVSWIFAKYVYCYYYVFAWASSWFIMCHSAMVKHKRNDFFLFRVRETKWNSFYWSCSLRKVEAYANASLLRSYQNYQNGAVSNQLGDVWRGGGGTVDWLWQWICWYVTQSTEKQWSIHKPVTVSHP